MNPMLRGTGRGSWDRGVGGDLESGTGEEKGVEMKCRSPQSEELDMNYLSFSSSSSPFHAATPLDARRADRIESHDSSAYDHQDIPGEEEYETDSSGSAKTGHIKS